MNFSKTEEETILFWRKIDCFQNQLRLTEDCERFTFYDGPPFATGMPHYGHLLTSTIKDIIPRYWSMKGRHVVRRFGWDTHGLPIEYEIDKKLGVSGRDAVMQMGIEKYNAECRAIVMRFSGEWRQMIERLGRWIDFDNDYKSMDASFMESCWWAFKELFEKDQVYRAYQIMPFSTALTTPLSQMESKQNEKMTLDPGVWVAFPVVGKDNVSLVIYTTTPWTLPSNLLVAVHPDFDYVEVLDPKAGKRYIMMESAIATLYPAKKTKSKKDKKDDKADSKKEGEKTAGKDEVEYQIVNKLKGKDMIGWKYEPLFDYFADQFSDCFQVIGASYVEEGEGTGLVHQAPAFGQEDYDAAVEAGFIRPERLPPCPVDDSGKFTDEVPDYVGQHVKAADKLIVKDVKEKGRLLLATQISHVDKFCYRSDTQLIRKAVSSWFIRVTNSIPDMLENLEPTTWVPSFVKEKRFGNWIAGAHDWNVSRNRYWGTPLPLWVSDDYKEVVCVGSVAELRELSGFTGPLDDLHRDKVDGITIPSKQGKGVLHRVDEVFDCWFESGSMPYASNHYPFAFPDKEKFLKNNFPADFIAEGLDQTRGWFYTLSILGTKLFGVSPFKAVIVNGLVLAEDGKKMSKSLKNFPDPKIVIDRYGSDALRLYLINSPVVRGEPLRFQEAGVRDVIAKVLLPMWNSYRFFSEQAHLYKSVTGNDYKCAPLSASSTTNVMDRWILAVCQSKLRFVDQEMAAYRLFTVVPRLLRVIDDLTNFYIRFNRKRLKGTAGLGLQDTEAALNTLCHVLFTLIRCLAPFIPFLTEHIYQLLRPYLDNALGELERVKDATSVHYLPFPKVQESLFDEVVERKMSVLQNVIQLARVARERKNIALRTPLLTLVVIAADEQTRSDIQDPELQTYITEELNVRDLLVTGDEEQERYGIQLQARVDWPTLGKKLKGNVKVVRAALPNLTQAQLKEYQRDGKLEIEGIPIETGDITIVRVMDPDSVAKASDHETANFEAAFSDDGLVVLLDTTAHPELAQDGLARDVTNVVQKMRKKAGLVPTDNILMLYTVKENPDEVEFEQMVEERQEQFVASLRGKLEKVGEAKSKEAILEEEHTFGQLVVKLQLCGLQ